MHFGATSLPTTIVASPLVVMDAQANEQSRHSVVAK